MIVPKHLVVTAVRLCLPFWMLAVIVPQLSAQTTSIPNPTMQSSVIVGVDAPFGGKLGWEAFTTASGGIGMLTRVQVDIMPAFAIPDEYALIISTMAIGIRGTIRVTSKVGIRLHGAGMASAPAFLGTNQGLVLAFGGTAGAGVTWDKVDLLCSTFLILSRDNFEGRWISIEAVFHR